MWGAVKDKWYADKPETIDGLKDNIREAINEIQLHTIDKFEKIFSSFFKAFYKKKKNIWRTL